MTETLAIALAAWLVSGYVGWHLIMRECVWPLRYASRYDNLMIVPCLFIGPMALGIAGLGLMR
jgi:hypothetical protein